MPEGACPDLLILPLYAAMPLELQVRITQDSRPTYISGLLVLLSLCHDICISASSRRPGTSTHGHAYTCLP